MQRMGLIEQRLMQFVDADVQVWHGPTETSGRHGHRLLQPVMRWLGQPSYSESTSRIRSAQADHSLTHAGNSVFALAVKAAGISGVGIDYESWRELDARHQRLMLTARESRLLPTASSRELLRIWTVKEACFKADRAGQQRWVTSYELHNPAQKTGTARVASQRHVHHFRYISMEVPGGMLSVAFKMES